MDTKLENIHLTLAQVRKEMGLSQAAIAEHLHIDQASVSYYENGKRGLPLEVLCRWCELLGIKITITLPGYEPAKEPDYEQRDLEEWSRLKRRRNTLIAEMRSLMAIRVLQAPEFQMVDEESGESRFWVYSFHADHSIGLVESRYDHTSQKHLAVEYTGEEANVYKFDPEFVAQSESVDRTYLTEDDFLTLGSNASPEEMELLKSTIFRERAGRPDGVELVNPEGFSIRSLWEIQESHARFSAIHDEVIGCAEYQEMEEELLQIEGLLDDLMIDNRLSNGMPNPAFVRWNDEDTAAVSVPLHEPERIWRWVEEGVSWAERDFKEPDGRQ